MDLGTLTNRLSYILNYNEGQTDQDFQGPSTYTDQRLHNALNDCYTNECNRAKQNGARDWFWRLQPLTWPASASTVAIPQGFKDRDIEAFRDDTDQDPGPIVRIYDAMTDGSGIYRRDMDTWGWYPAPSSARSLQIIYVAAPEVMKQNGDEPSLLPSDHHEVIIWSAAILLKTIADEVAPQMWQQRHAMLQRSLWKELAMGHVRQGPGRRIKNSYPDIIKSI